jgi:hypothetical protein
MLDRRFPTARPDLAAALALVFALVLAAPAWAGLLENRDPEPHAYEVYWDDMEAPIKGVIEPGEVIELRDSPCTISLPEKHDSMYMRPGEHLSIRKGILRRPKEEK